MGTTEIQQALLDATQLLSQKNVKEANYAVTIKCTIKAIVDAGLNLYTVEYGGNQFNVYGDSNISYKINDIVYVLVPDNNFNQEKHIIGAVAPRATMLVDEEVNSDVYVPLSGNLFTRIADVNLKSWKDTTSLVDIDTNNFSMVFSDYLDTYRNFLFTARIKTNIDKNHQMSGNYGLILNLPFIHTSENGTTTKVWQSYAMDVNTMQGNPYAFNEYNKVDLYYEIDDSLTYDASREPYITSFVSGFGYTEDRTGIDYDIFIKDISVEMIDVLSESEKDGYYLALTATGGNYFLRGKFDTSKVITPTLKIKGKTTNDFSSWDCYWFVEDTSIDTSSEGYLSVGGLGWKCLNKKTNIAYDSNGKQSYQYVTNNYALPITNEDIISSLRYKCVLIQDEIVVGASIQIKNLNSNIILHLVSATGSNFFVENIGEVRLKARIYYPGVTDGSSNITLSTAWQRFDKSDTYIDNNFYTLIKDNDPVVITDATGNSKTYFETEISYPCSKLEKLNTVNCTFYSTTVKNGNTIKSNLGTVSIIVGTASNFTYGLTIDGGDVLYKYDSDGDSPLVANYDGPLSSKIKTISPISFRVYKADGTELTETEYLYCQYRWSFPKNSMMTLTGYNLNSLSQDDDYYYITGYGKNSINYTILSTFNKRRTNNTIILSASFAGNELSNSVTPKFLKEGESGTNGTKYSGIITYQDYGYGERDNNNKIRKLQLVYIAGTGWRLYDVVNQSLVAFGTPQLRVQVYADGSLITSGYSVVWEMFDNASSGSSLGTTNITCFNIGRTNGVISAVRNWDTVGDIYTNIVRATVTITAGSDASSREILYIYYPIEITRLNRTLSKIPSLVGGFDEVVYGSDGTNPEYDNTNPFECVDNLYNNTTGYYTYVWAKSGNLQGTVRNSYQQKFTPVSKFDNGISKNYVKVTLTLSDSERGKINNLISSLTTQRNNATNLVNFYTADKKNLLDFVAKFEYNSYINQLNECKQLLLLRGQAIQIIDNMYPILEQINTYCIYNKINPLDFDYQRYYVSCGNSLDNARSSLYDLLNTGTLSYLNSLVSAEIVINENIKSKYNISVFNQLKNFIASWSEQLNKYISYYTELTKQINRVYVYQESLNKLQTITSNLIALSNNSQIIALTTAHNGNNAEQKYINLKNQITALVNKISSAEGGLNTYAILVNNLLKPINELLKVYKNTTYQTNYYNSLIKKYSDIVTSCNNQIAGYQAALLPAATDAIAHIKPIIMVYNRYELSHLNGWDGNKLYLDSNNNEYLFMPQMGAGAKDSNNTFTGIVMGVKKFNNNTSNQQIGLFGYSSGSQSIFLNAKNGSATFGVSGKGQVIIEPSSNSAIIKSGNYSVANKTGMQISLSNPEEIRFGSGNFVVNSSGHVTAKGGGSIAGWIISDTQLYSNVTAANGRLTLDSSGVGKIYSHSHTTLTSTNAGFYLSQDGLSIGDSIRISSATNGTVQVGKISGNKKWTISGDTNNSYIAYNTNAFACSNLNNANSYSIGGGSNQVYNGTDGIRLGNKFAVDNNGNLVTKSLIAKESGNIAGWTINSTSLSATGITIGSNGNISGDGTGGRNWSITRGSATFNNLTANGIGQIGGWNIGSNSLSSSGITINSNGNISGEGDDDGHGGKTGSWSIYKGSATFNNLTANGTGQIGGWTISNDKLTGGETKLHKNGKIECNNLIANSTGEIGGWTIRESTLTGGDTTLDSDGTITCSKLVANNEGSIGGFTISGNALTGSGVTLENGAVKAGDVSMGGGQLSGPNFALGSSGLSLTGGSISMGDSTWTGSGFTGGGNASYGSTSSTPFSGGCQDHIKSLAVNEVKAQKAQIGYLVANDITASIINAGIANADITTSQKISGGSLSISGSAQIGSSLTVKGIQLNGTLSMGDGGKIPILDNYALKSWVTSCYVTVAGVNYSVKHGDD